MGKKLRKGASLDALGGLNMPEAAGIFAATGTQGISAATLGLKPVGNLGPINSNPGVSAAFERRRVAVRDSGGRWN